jgi:hypothetical protein
MELRIRDASETYPNGARALTQVSLTILFGVGGVKIVPLTLLGAASATRSPALARMGGERELLDAAADAIDSPGQS